MKTISIDIETYSSVDLKTCGMYKFAESPDFEVLLFAYSVDGGEVQIVDLAAGEKLLPEVLAALTDDTVQKWAFNAAFERVCLSRYLGVKYLSPESWRCSMVWAAYMGLPLSLKNAGAALKLDKQKLSAGKDLIRYFCSPCKPTARNGQRTRNLPEHASEQWAKFKQYNMRDVETEMEIQRRLANYPMPENIWDEYHQDQRINDLGVWLDLELVRQAVATHEKSREALVRQMKNVTGLDNPNSVAQMKCWLAEKGFSTDSLGKKAVAGLIQAAPGQIGMALELRQQLAKTSVKKYAAMANAACADGRARGLFQFYGANRTGRWSGRILQPQNLPQNHLPDLAQARGLVRSGNFAALEMLYPSVPDVLSELIRTAFVPKPGRKFIVADFSAIEARVIAWLAGEKWRNDVFATHGKIYEASAAQMFKVPIETVTKDSPLRQKGKVAELALGYGGSVGALKAMGALEMGLSEKELKPLVNSWRRANKKIEAFWWAIDNTAIEAVRDKTSVETHGIKLSFQNRKLFITLPSGRRLVYIEPQLEPNSYGGDSITYMGLGATKKWERLETYGPKLVENIVQATSRDILAHAMQILRNCDIVIHIHDELIIEADLGLSVEAVCEQMSRTPDWAVGLLLKAEGFECDFYQKQ
jgi:DNA polymerase